MKVCSKCNLNKDTTEFYTHRRTCKSCYFAQQYSWQADNLDKKREYTRKSMAKRYKEDPTVLLEKGIAWRQQNRDWVKEYNKNYVQNNPEIIAQSRRLREHSIRQQTPSWANKDEIKSFYALAKSLTLETNILHTVDHVIPLQGKIVSGLHVENNLQILTKSENSKKRNIYAHTDS